MSSLGKLVGRQVESSVQPAGSVPISVPASVPEEQGVCCSSLLFLRDILSDRDFWNFHLAPVSGPLLRADFLQHFDLLVNVKGHCLVNSQYPEDYVIHASVDPVPAFRRAWFLSAPQCIQKLLSEFPDVLSSDGFTTSKPSHGVRHDLLTNPGPPV